MAMFSSSLYVGTMIEYLTVSPPPFAFLVVVVLVDIALVPLLFFLSPIGLFPHCVAKIFPAKILKRLVVLNENRR